MIIIIDYGIGNLASVANTLNKLRIPNRISDDSALIRKSKALILPGVGAAGEGMNNLRKMGLDKVIKEEIRRGKKFLGICLGMQLLFDYSEEGSIDCLGILKGRVKKFKKERKVPQIGWNRVKYQKFLRSRISLSETNSKDQKLFKDIPDESYFYFVNSYYCIPEDKPMIIGITKYGEEFASLIIKDNILATQFHPEKSGNVGMQFLKNWSRL